MERGRLVGAQQRHLIFLRQLHHLGEGLQLVAAGDDDGRRLLAEQAVQRFVPAGGRLHREEVDLGQAHDLQPEVVEKFIVAGQEQARAVDLRDLHIDPAQLAGGVDHFHVDALGELGERDSKIIHPCILPVAGRGGRPIRFGRDLQAVRNFPFFIL